MGRLGLFGGTFDPPHLGHLILASVLADALSLDAVWFVPAADPPHKQNRAISPVEHRLVMLRLAIGDNPLFEVSRIDLDRPGPHYSVDMVTLARQQRPDAEWFFLMGGDSLHDLPGWHQPDRLLELCRVAVQRRPGTDLDLDALARRLPGLRDRVIVVEGPEIALSSTLIGSRVRAGLSIRYLVPESVRAYIHEHHLYVSSGG